jgi:integrase
VVTSQGSRGATSITGLVDHWKASKERPDAKTYDRHAKALGDFAAFLGHDDATRVTSHDLPRWMNSLLEKKLSAKTINEGYRAGVKSCFAAGAAAGVLRVDPLAGVKYKIKADPTRAAPRVPYRDADAATLLTAAKEEQGARRWLPYLLAYTGARIGEVSQLYREDVRWASLEEAMKGGWCEGEVAKPKSRDGIYFLRLTNEGKGQRLKNAASRREVPLHPALIEAGFIEFVASAKPSHFLFPELTAGKYGHKGDGGSRTYRKWARGEVGIKDARLTAHSWRHRFEDQLRHIGAPDEVRDGLAGHARKGMGARYGHGHSIATKAEWISKLPVIKANK